MPSMSCVRGIWVTACLAALPLTAFAQDRPDPYGAFVGPFSRTRPALGAPFSADATTIIRQTEPDGRRRRRQATARYYRDSMGRVRVEYNVPADGSRGNVTASKRMAMLLPDPGNLTVYTVDDSTQTAHLNPGFAGLIFNASTAFAIPTGTVRFTIFHTADVHTAPSETVESLGTTRIEGLTAEGLRATGVTQVGQVDERWESPIKGGVVRATRRPRYRRRHRVPPDEYYARRTSV
jgi:hypothetical protein